LLATEIAFDDHQKTYPVHCSALIILASKALGRGADLAP